MHEMMHLRRDSTGGLFDDDDSDGELAGPALLLGSTMNHDSENTDPKDKEDEMDRRFRAILDYKSSSLNANVALGSHSKTNADSTPYRRSTSVRSRSGSASVTRAIGWDGLMDLTMSSPMQSDVSSMEGSAVRRVLKTMDELAITSAKNVTLDAQRKRARDISDDICSDEESEFEESSYEDSEGGLEEQIVTQTRPSYSSITPHSEEEEGDETDRVSVGERSTQPVKQKIPPVQLESDRRKQPSAAFSRRKLSFGRRSTLNIDNNNNNNDETTMDLPISEDFKDSLDIPNRIDTPMEPRDKILKAVDGLSAIMEDARGSDPSDNTDDDEFQMRVNSPLLDRAVRQRTNQKGKSQSSSLLKKTRSLTSVSSTDVGSSLDSDELNSLYNRRSIADSSRQSQSNKVTSSVNRRNFRRNVEHAASQVTTGLSGTIAGLRQNFPSPSPFRNVDEENKEEHSSSNSRRNSRSKSKSSKSSRRSNDVSDTDEREERSDEHEDDDSDDSDDDEDGDVRMSAESNRSNRRRKNNRRMKNSNEKSQNRRRKGDDESKEENDLVSEPDSGKRVATRRSRVGKKRRNNGNNSRKSKQKTQNNENDEIKAKKKTLKKPRRSGRLAKKAAERGGSKQGDLDSSEENDSDDDAQSEGSHLEDDETTSKRKSKKNSSNKQRAVSKQPTKKSKHSSSDSKRSRQASMDSSTSLLSDLQVSPIHRSMVSDNPITSSTEPFEMMDELDVSSQFDTSDMPDLEASSPAKMNHDHNDNDDRQSTMEEDDYHNHSPDVTMDDLMTRSPSNTMSVANDDDDSNDAHQRRRRSLRSRHRDSVDNINEFNSTDLDGMDATESPLPPSPRHHRNTAVTNNQASNSKSSGAAQRGRGKRTRKRGKEEESQSPPPSRSKKPSKTQSKKQSKKSRNKKKTSKNDKTKKTSRKRSKEEAESDDTTLLFGPRKPKDLVVIPDEASRLGVRRSKRVRFQPLKFWANERIEPTLDVLTTEKVKERLENGELFGSDAGADWIESLGHHPRKKRRKKTYSKKKKKSSKKNGTKKGKSEAGGSSSSAHSPSLSPSFSFSTSPPSDHHHHRTVDTFDDLETDDDGRFEHFRGLVKQFDVWSGRTRTIEFAKPACKVNMKALPLPEDCQRPETLKAVRGGVAIQQDQNFTVGFVTIPPDGYKMPETTRMTEIFTVIAADPQSLLVEINTPNDNLDSDNDDDDDSHDRNHHYHRSSLNGGNKSVNRRRSSGAGKFTEQIQTEKMSKGCVFAIWPENRYSMRNLSKKHPITLSFTLVIDGPLETSIISETTQQSSFQE